MNNENDYNVVSEFEKAIFSKLNIYSEFNFIVNEKHLNRLEIIGTDTNNKTVFRIILNIDNIEPKEVQIPIIILLDKLRHNGIGKQIIYLIYNICKEYGYRLFIVDLVPSFYQSLVNRGAKIIELYDAVEITDGTRLT